MRYDPEKPPAPDVWLALDEDESRQLVARHHRSPRCEHSPAPNQRLHNLTHVIVENQAATPDLPVADALARLVEEGLTRHDAVHAVGAILSRYLFHALGPEAMPPDFDQYYAEVRALTAESWQQSAGPVSDPHDAFTDLHDDDLLQLLFTEGDGLPRAAVDELRVRSPRLLGDLIAIVVDPHNWQEPLPDWWAPIHATFILATIPDPTGDAAILSAMREADARWNDWIIEVMPAILGARGTRLRPTLLQVLGNRNEPSGVRCMALDGLVASTFVDPEGRDAILTRVGEIFTAADESSWVREHAGQVLLDLQVRAYEPALMDFARRATEASNAERERGIPGGLAFSVDDVLRAFREPQRLGRYQRSWLDFYDDRAIAERQRRWREEAASAAARPAPEAPPPKVGRNEPCPCGSGRKFKKCCLGA